MDSSQYDRQVIDRALNLLAQKSGDYNCTVNRDEYFPHGLLSYHQMLHTKVMRIKSILTSDHGPNYESIEDTLLDLLNYTIMSLSYLEFRKNDTRTEGTISS